MIDDTPVFVPACQLGGVIETTGAGDTFCASVLNYLLEHGLEGLSVSDREDMLRFANAAMPDKAQVLNMLNEKQGKRNSNCPG